MDERDIFELIVRLRGRLRVIEPATNFRRLDIRPIAVDGECWNGAWTAAQNNGWKYVEGTCYKPGDIRVRAHAWAERTDGFGGTVVVECTEGYEDCIAYMGVAMDPSKDGPVDKITSAFGNERYSVIEYLVAVQGWSPRRVIDFLGI